MAFRVFVFNYKIRMESRGPLGKTICRCTSRKSKNLVHSSSLPLADKGVAWTLASLDPSFAHQCKRLALTRGLWLPCSACSVPPSPPPGGRYPEWLFWGFVVNGLQRDTCGSLHPNFRSWLHSLNFPEPRPERGHWKRGLDCRRPWAMEQWELDKYHDPPTFFLK